MIVYINTPKGKGDQENMEKNTRTKGNYLQAGYHTLHENDMLELNASQLHQAAAPSDVEYMREFLSKEEVGRYHWFENLGFTLQNAGAGILRCIHIVDHEAAILSLSIVRQTIEFAGGRLELAPYTVIRPMADAVEGPQESEEQEVAQVVGMEVA